VLGNISFLGNIFLPFWWLEVFLPSWIGIFIPSWCLEIFPSLEISSSLFGGWKFSSLLGLEFSSLLGDWKYVSHVRLKLLMGNF
jgi:hypothetical protein